MIRRDWIKSMLLLTVVLLTGLSLAAWKYETLQSNEASSTNQPEPIEVVTVASVRELDHRPTTTSIGTVLALRSITLRNELPGTVRQVRLMPGHIVEAGTILVALDVAVEEAELKAQEAQVALARTVFDRRRHLSQDLAAAQEEVDRARADLDVGKAQIARIKAIIERKTIRAPFRARVGIADVHPGQYLNEGTALTTLQGVDDAAHVDFSVTQQVAVALHEGQPVDVFPPGVGSPLTAIIVALDARVDPATRNAIVRAKLDRAAAVVAPGSSVRVRVSVGASRKAVAVPVSAVRKGPGGDQVFVVSPDAEGRDRAHVRAVESGAMVGDEMVIHAGLAPGERIAASGSFKLREAVLVKDSGENSDLAQVMTRH
ncbi:MexH family multidrug efflux RND transporter periplasmic adaptor subunit [Nitrospira sp.]|nr:MexH family multidrug efflux RND transporter periplasmic adaptor subunit [Nitrospira sp.]